MEMLSPATAVMLDIRRTLGLPKLEKEKEDEMMIKVFNKEAKWGENNYTLMRAECRTLATSFAAVQE